MEGSCDLELGLRISGAHIEEDDRGRLESATVSGRTQREHLTIIYKGEVCVYENVSEDQARAIILLAGCGERPPGSSEVHKGKELSLVENILAPRRPKSVPFVGPIERGSNAKAAATSLTMKRSLQRFLQKRKVRTQKPSGSPY